MPIFLFIIIAVSFFPFLTAYGDSEFTEYFCQLHGWGVSESDKSCLIEKRLTPFVTDSNYTIEKFAIGLEFPVSMDFVGDDMLVLEKHSGKVIRISDDGTLYDEPILDVSVRFNYYSGLLGIATLYDRVFLYYTESSSGEDVREGSSELDSVDAKNRVYQYDWNGEKLSNPVLIKEFIAQLANNHHGGAMTKGLDNEIYFVIGDEGQSGVFENRVENICYKVTFVHTECTDEPVYETGSIFKIDTGSGNSIELFAMGVRNSFGLDVDPVTGYLWDTENGENYFDEINLVKPRFNSGWNSVMGPADRENPDTHPCAGGVLGNESNCPVEYRGSQPIPPTFENFVYSDPEFSFHQTVGPTAIAFPDDSFGHSDMLFVSDYHHGTIYKFPLNSDRTGFNFSNPKLVDLVVDGDIEMQPPELFFAYNFPGGGITDIAFHNGAMYVTNMLSGTIYKIYPIQFTGIFIPDWVKNNAAWWVIGQIDDSAYVLGLEWLISNGIIKIPIAEYGTQSETSVIPNWIKSNAGWWASGQIDENEYIRGLQWLITNGIIVI